MNKKFINVKFSLLEEFFPYFYVMIENYNIEGIEELLYVSRMKIGTKKLNLNS